MKLFAYSPFSHRPSNNFVITPQQFCMSKLLSISLLMTAYSKEKLKTILMQNFGGKHYNVNIMVNKSFEWFFEGLSVHEAETGC